MSRREESALTSVVLPASAIGLIRDQLDLGGIAEGKLITDLDGLAEEMRRYNATSVEPANPLM